ncbi:MAG: COX15/CtaA family protein [Flammeovirgaceae bacterium]
MRKGRLFRRFSAFTIGSIYLLILVGGIVRSTGSGMGCPDWPKCFGSYVPPTHVSQLPENYQEIYSQKRAKKNESLANYLSKMGFGELAFKIKNDKSILEEAAFNVTKTWIEYINRLIGVLIGLFVFGTLLFSFSYWKMDRTIVGLAFLSFVLVGFQGWIGSLVVSTNLLPGMVSIHMLIALAIVALLIYIVARSYKGILQTSTVSNLKRINTVLIVGIVLFIIQIVLGTKVRENVDLVAASFDYLQREKWIESLDWSFYIHRSYSLVILGLHGYLWHLLNKNIISDKRLSNWNKVLLACIVFEILTGTMMAYFAIPAFLQPVHLLFANLIFGIQFLILILLNFERFFGKINSFDKEKPLAVQS